MSNARNLANLLGTSTTIGTSDIADDAITNAKIQNDAVTGAKIEDNPTIAGNLTIAGDTTAQGTTIGFVSFDKLLLNATDGSATDAGDNLILNGTDATSANADSSILFDDATGDPNFVSSGGKILQIVEGKLKSSLIISPGNSFTEVVGLDASITPSSPSSKILVTCNLFCTAMGSGSSVTGYTVGIRLYHRSGSGSYSHLEDASATPGQPQAKASACFIAAGEQNYSNYGRSGVYGSYLHTTNSTDPQSYKLFVNNEQTSNGRVAINRPNYTTNQPYMYPSVSTFTLYEIGA